MPEYLKAFIVVVFIASIVLMFAKLSFEQIVSAKDFNRRAGTWLLITGILFLAGNFWLFIIGVSIAIQIAKLREKNYVSLYFMLLFVAPAYASVNISGFGIINYLFALNPIRLLSLIILLPAAVALSTKRHTIPMGRTSPDKLLIAYLLLTVLLHLRQTTLTDTLRYGFYTWTDALLPYYVASRALRSMEEFRDAIGAFVVGTLMLAGMAILEYFKHWMLYSSILSSFSIITEWGNYMERAGSLRASVTTGQPIVLGFVLMVSSGFYLYLQQYISNVLIRRLMLVIMVGGLFASISRGPWVGMLIFVLLYNMLGYKAMGATVKLLVGGGVAVLLIMVLPGGEKLIQLLPWIGSVEQGNIAYRSQLYEMSMIVIQQHLWFGSVNFLSAPEMQSLVQGEGIIDLVNSYLGISLRYGVIGLSLFVAFFVSILLGVYKSARLMKLSGKGEYRLGITLFALLVAQLFTITTVSSILIIPVIYWAVAGMAVGYIQMVQTRQVASNREPDYL